MLAWHNFIYLAPVALFGLAAALRAVGVDVDALGAVDGSRPRRKLRALRRFLSLDSEPVGFAVAFLVAGWSVTGLALTRAYPAVRVGPGVLIAIGAAAAVAWAAALLGTTVIRRMLPAEDTTQSLADLVGHTATVVSDRVDGAHGRARVTTAAGHAVTVQCRYADDGDDPVNGEAVFVMAYDEATGVFDVIR